MLTASLPFGRGSRVTSRGSKTPDKLEEGKWKILINCFRDGRIQNLKH